MFGRFLRNLKVRQIRNILLALLLIFATGSALLFWQIQEVATQIPLTPIRVQQLFLARVGLFFITIMILINGIFLVLLGRGAWRDGFIDGMKDGYLKAKTDGLKKV